MTVLTTPRLTLRHWHDQDLPAFAAQNAAPTVMHFMPGRLSRPTPCVEIAWRLARTSWGHGYATEAARECLRFAFEALALPDVVAFTVPANVRSRALMERLGMVRNLRDDFDHPRLPPEHALTRHVLYRLPRGVWASSTAAVIRTAP